MMIMRWEDATPEQYEILRKEVDWEGQKPDGALFHMASFGNDALHVVDLWESPEDFNRFVEKRLMPGVKKAGIPGAPQVELYPLHALYLPDASRLS